MSFAVSDRTRKKAIIALVVVLGIVLAACTRNMRPVEDQSQSMPGNIEQDAALADIERCLVLAGSYRGWARHPASDEGDLHLRRLERHHMAHVRVEYDSTQYRLSYVDSANLRHSENERILYDRQRDTFTEYEGEVISVHYYRWTDYLLETMHSVLSQGLDHCDTEASEH
ncbi:hypothetical protein J2T60_002208 [Natronospira proteinivora]|uniref:Lipoprotein n=1 Tax=Natronospira proteinivora TaxID=1807133 RepID=A0ABT1GCW6_9GAMM|nr:hypothetical protein [Natronospira proteinivora]MCP1728208.1 hypothetical protein [Natronospira proteinivora]